MKFGELLREVRKAEGFTQETLSKASGVPLPSIRGYEQCLRVPSLTIAVKLARGMRVSLDRLADFDEARERRTAAKRSGKAIRRA